MTHLSTLQLHQLRLGELGPTERAPLDAHLDECARCAARLGHQAATRAAFVATPVPAAIAGLDAPGPWARLWKRLAGARELQLLAPALLALAIVVRASGVLDGGAATPDDAAPTERTKGSAIHQEAPYGAAERPKGLAPRLEAWVQAGDSARPLYTGEAVAAGTRVQLKYDPGHHRFVTLAGRDAQGVVEVYGTFQARGPGVTAAPYALTLDDARGEQAFFAILTHTKPEPDAVLSALGREPVRMERGEIASLVLRKE